MDTSYILYKGLCTSILKLQTEAGTLSVLCDLCCLSTSSTDRYTAAETMVNDRGPRPHLVGMSHELWVLCAHCADKNQSQVGA